jgi:hypothetical protein
MSKYILTRKQADIFTIQWERLHAKNQQTESLYMFLIKKQALHMADELFHDGVKSDKLERLKKELINKDRA